MIGGKLLCCSLDYNIKYGVHDRYMIIVEMYFTVFYIKNMPFNCLKIHSTIQKSKQKKKKEKNMDKTNKMLNCNKKIIEQNTDYTNLF